MTQDTVSPCIGSTISLISNHEIRYEGTLYTVDSKKCTIALANVRSFGTENRPTAQPIGPQSEVYDFIVFKASDIKDLTVCESKKQGVAHAVDPAILSYSCTPERQAGSTSFQLYGTSPPSGSPKFPAGVPPSSMFGGYMEQQQQNDYGWEQIQRRSAFIASPGNGTRPQVRQPPFFQQNVSPKVPSRSPLHMPVPPMPFISKTKTKPLKFDTDYDFEKANEQFRETLVEVETSENAAKQQSKEEVKNSDQPPQQHSTKDDGGDLQPKESSAAGGESLGHDDSSEKTGTPTAVVKEEPDAEKKDDSKTDEELTPKAEVYYDKKSSFFDSISCENRDRTGGWKRDMRTNEETFGPEDARSISFQQQGGSPGGFFGAPNAGRFWGHGGRQDFGRFARGGGGMQFRPYNVTPTPTAATTRRGPTTPSIPGARY